MRSVRSAICTSGDPVSVVVPALADDVGLRVCHGDFLRCRSRVGRSRRATVGARSHHAAPHVCDSRDGPLQATAASDSFDSRKPIRRPPVPSPARDAPASGWTEALAKRFGAGRSARRRVDLDVAAGRVRHRASDRAAAARRRCCASWPGSSARPTGHGDGRRRVTRRRPPAKRIGFVPQSPALLPWRTVEANARLLTEVNRARRTGARACSTPRPTLLARGRAQATSSTPTRTSCRAACSSAWRSCGPSPSAPRSC